MLESLFNKDAGLQACNFIKKETPTQMFSCESCEIFKNTFLKNTANVNFHHGSSEIKCYIGSLNIYLLGVEQTDHGPVSMLRFRC